MTKIRSDLFFGIVSMVHIIAHRGLRHETPENTAQGIADALRLPVHGVEFDVELAGDGIPVVLHQETLVPDRDFKRIELATRDFVSRDWVREHTSEEIRRLDAGRWMGEHFAHITVPLLTDVLALNWGTTTAYVELKDATYWRAERDPSRPHSVVVAAVPLLLNFKGHLAVISFNPEILRLLRERAPHIPTTLALWTEWRGKQAEAVAAAKKCRASAISLPYQVVLEDPTWVDAAHQNGLAVHAYPVSPARDEGDFKNYTPESQVPTWLALKSLAVDAIISDFARETLQALQGY